MFVSTNKAGDEIIRIMNETRLPRFHEPKAPRFVLTDRQGKFALGIGGYVRATAEYDFGGIVKDVDFYPALIPNKGSADRARNQFQMDISTSTLFLKLVGHTKRLGDFVVYTAANFRGDGKPSNCKMLMPPSSALPWDTVMVTLWTWPPYRPPSTSPALTAQLSIVPPN